jgi:hypothetical protein
LCSRFVFEVRDNSEVIIPRHEIWTNIYTTKLLNLFI